MAVSKLEEITHELKILWNYLTRKELCDYYSVTDRTLYNYRKKLDLPAKPGEGITVTNTVKKGNGKDSVELWIHKDKKYHKTTFKNWEHFSVWAKAHKSMVINTMVRNGSKYITCEPGTVTR